VKIRAAQHLISPHAALRRSDSFPSRGSLLAAQRTFGSGVPRCLSCRIRFTRKSSAAAYPSPAAGFTAPSISLHYFIFPYFTSKYYIILCLARSKERFFAKNHNAPRPIEEACD
jgi:hypothetical protein